MSEYIPGSSAEYIAIQKKAYLAPKVCEISSIEWRTGKNLMVFFLWNDKVRYVNIARECRQKFGKLTEEVRNAVIEAVPKVMTVSTRVKKFGGNNRRFLHDFNSNELNAWLERVQI